MALSDLNSSGKLFQMYGPINFKLSLNHSLFAIGILKVDLLAKRVLWLWVDDAAIGLKTWKILSGLLEDDDDYDF